MKMNCYNRIEHIKHFQKDYSVQLIHLFHFFKKMKFSYW